MRVIRETAAFRQARQALPAGATLGFVPTMGALHAGHGSLVQRAREENDFAAVSIFVNPTQFGPNEDLDAYPRTLARDCELLESLGVDIVFAPDTQQIYASRPAQVQFSLRDLDKVLCGAKRPGHFNGVLQVVSILFNIVQPSNAYFGLKDYQQFVIIRHLAEELHFPLNLTGCATVRESDGLAMSSRNVYLNAEERSQALCLFRILSFVKAQLKDFQTVGDVKARVQTLLAQYPLARLDYFEILNDVNLEAVENLSPLHHPRAFMAVFMGNTRLIDNMSLYESRSGFE